MAARRRWKAASEVHKKASEVDRSPRFGSHDEALRRLCQASRDSSISAFGDFVRVREDGTIEEMLRDRIGVEIPSVIFDYDARIRRFFEGNEIETPWGGGVWINVKYKIEEIDRLCELETKLEAQTVEATPTGLAGRPTKGREIIFAEYIRRRDAGEVLSKVAAEASTLRLWYKQNYPTAQHPASKTVENLIRREHQRFKAAPTKSPIK